MAEDLEAFMATMMPGHAACARQERWIETAADSSLIPNARAQESSRNGPSRNLWRALNVPANLVFRGFEYRSALQAVRRIRHTKTASGRSEEALLRRPTEESEDTPRSGHGGFGSGRPAH